MGIRKVSNPTCCLIVVFIGLTLVIWLMLHTKLDTSNTLFNSGKSTELSIQGGFNIITAIPAMERETTSKLIMYMEGWIDDEWLYDADVNYDLYRHSNDMCGYICDTTRIGETRMSDADLLVFQISALKLNPPKKYHGQVWMLLSFEEITDSVYEKMAKRGYDKLIDVYSVQSPTTVTPLLFSKKANSQLNESLFTTFPMPVVDNNLRVFQIVSSCIDFTAKYVEKTILPKTPAYQLKTLDSSIVLGHRLYCHDRKTRFKSHFHNRVKFDIIDHSACFLSIVGQLQIILASSDLSIPVIVQLPNHITKTDLIRYVPPNSFISGSDFASHLELINYMKKIVHYPSMYYPYQDWRNHYTLQTKAGIKHYFSLIRQNQCTQPTRYFLPTAHRPQGEGFDCKGAFALWATVMILI